MTGSNAASNAIMEAVRVKQVERYDKLAADAYRKVVMEHYASAHVEDARDRLAAMNLPIPEPSKEQIAASTALENSRSNYTISNKLEMLILHKPDVVLAATSGDPTLADPKPVIAPDVVKGLSADYLAAYASSLPAAAGSAPAAAPAAATPGAASEAAPVATPAATAAPLGFNDVPSADGSTAAPANLNASPIRPSSGANSGSLGVEILPSSNAAPASVPAATPASNMGLKSVGPDNAEALPAIEKPAAAPDRPNQVDGPTTPGQVIAPGAKAPKPAFDKSDESSSKHKKKKGLKKLDPIPH